MKIWSFLQPTIQKVSVLSLLLLLWIIQTWKVATCKVCWEQNHGFPFTFIVLEKISIGSYSYSIEFLDISALALNLSILYFVSCITTSFSNIGKVLDNKKSKKKH